MFVKQHLQNFCLLTFAVVRELLEMLEEFGLDGYVRGLWIGLYIGGGCTYLWQTVSVRKVASGSRRLK